MAVEESIDICAARQTSEPQGLAPQTAKRSYRLPSGNLF
jgi:hypothetical protein